MSVVVKAILIYVSGMSTIKIFTSIQFHYKRNVLILGDIKKESSPPKRPVAVSARPRRLSEVEIKDQEKPIPDGSSFFIFSKTNL